MGNPIAQGASTIYEGSKNVIIDGKDYIKKGVATVTPTATNVSKVLVRGAGGLALSVAVEQLLGAVDWVLDPANNQIRYNDPTIPVDPNDPSLQYIWKMGNYSGSSAPNACNEYVTKFMSTWHGNVTSKMVGTTCFTVTSTGQEINTGTPQRVANPNYDPQATSEDREKLWHNRQFLVGFFLSLWHNKAVYPPYFKSHG